MGGSIAKWEVDFVDDGDSNYALIIGAEKKDDAIVDMGYRFEVRRFKDKNTKEEFLNVKAFETDDPNEPCAEIERANIVELENKLLNLRLYGVMLERKNYPKIRQAIESNYSQIKRRYIDNSTTVTQSVVIALYEMFVRYIKDIGVEPQGEYYHIPVTEFKEHIEDTEFSKYKYSDLRKGLAELELEVNGSPVRATKCSFGRHDNTIVVGEQDKKKRLKVISFVAEVVDNYQIT